MMNPFHILQGWFYSLIWTPKNVEKLSKERLMVCKTCPFAVEKSFLKFREDSAFEEKTKACKFCGCPVQEKSLVPKEKCELKLWKK